MCWSAEIAFSFAIAEGLALAYIWCRNRHFDRVNALVLLPVMLQELVQGFLWPHVTVARNLELGWDDPGLHNCSSANRIYSYLIVVVVCGIPTWFELAVEPASPR